MLFEARQKIIFIGDSITEAGRVPMATLYGDGYVNLVHSLLSARYPQLQLTIVNKGIGGNTTRDLVERWQQDVIDEQPDWLAIKIGINDVCMQDKHVPLSEYTAILRKLLAWTRNETSARLILLQPYLIEPDRDDPLRLQLAGYSAVVKMLASEYEAILVETQVAFDAVLQHTPPVDWWEGRHANDRVHPNLPGHAVIALALLRAIGFSW